MLQTGSATTESENAGLLHTYLGTTRKPSSASTSSVRDRTDKSVFFVLKAPTENVLLRNGH